MEQLKIAARWKIHEGKMEEFKSLAKETFTIVMKDNPHHLQYDWHFNDELNECVVMENYRDSNAFLMHLSVVGEVLGKFMTMADFKGEIFGNPSQQMLDAIAPFNITVYYFYQGAERQVNELSASLS